MNEKNLCSLGALPTDKQIVGAWWDDHADSGGLAMGGGAIKAGN